LLKKKSPPATDRKTKTTVLAGAAAGGIYQAWLPQLKGTVKVRSDMGKDTRAGAWWLVVFRSRLFRGRAPPRRADCALCLFVPPRARSPARSSRSFTVCSSHPRTSTPSPKHTETRNSSSNKQADTNPFSTNALAATSIEQQIKSDTTGAAAALTLGQDNKSSKKAIGKAVKSAIGASSKSG
jgi:hypothetical protein